MRREIVKNRIKEENLLIFTPQDLHRFLEVSKGNAQRIAERYTNKGIEYKEVSEAHTSQRCCKCGEEGVRNKGLFGGEPMKGWKPLRLRRGGCHDYGRFYSKREIKRY